DADGVPAGAEVVVATGPWVGPEGAGVAAGALEQATEVSNSAMDQRRKRTARGRERRGLIEPRKSKPRRRSMADLHSGVRTREVPAPDEHASGLTLHTRQGGAWPSCSTRGAGVGRPGQRPRGVCLEKIIPYPGRSAVEAFDAVRGFF